MASKPGPVLYRADWAIDLCAKYSSSIFTIGKWTVVLAIVLGVTLAAAKVFLALKSPSSGAEPEEKVTPPAPGFVEMLKELVQAVASAPTWLALFGGGVLLIWMAGNVVPDQCGREIRPPEPKSE